MFDPDARDLFEVRADVAALWPTLDGSTTLAELAHELAEVTDIDAEAARDLVRAVVEPLLADGLVMLLPAAPEPSP